MNVSATCVRVYLPYEAACFDRLNSRVAIWDDVFQVIFCSCTHGSLSQRMQWGGLGGNVEAYVGEVGIHIR